MTKETAAGMAPYHRPGPDDCTGIVDFLHVKWEVLHQRYSRPFCGSGGFEGLPLDFDDAAFYRRFDSFSKSGRQMREEGRDHGAILLG